MAKYNCHRLNRGVDRDDARCLSRVEPRGFLEEALPHHHTRCNLGGHDLDRDLTIKCAVLPENTVPWRPAQDALDIRTAPRRCAQRSV